MAIKFTCPNCDTNLSAPEEYAGRMAKCHACNQPTEIPSAPPIPKPSPEKVAAAIVAVSTPPIETPAKATKQVDHWGGVASCLTLAAVMAALFAACFPPAALAGLLLATGAIPAVSRSRGVLNQIAGAVVCLVVAGWCGLNLVLSLTGPPAGRIPMIP